MAGKNQDWLPEGWTFEFRTGSGGTKTKVYIDPRTGKKFKSKPEVLRYLSGEVHVPKKRTVLSSDTLFVPGVESNTKILKVGERASASFEHPPSVPSEWLVGPGSKFFASVIEEFKVSYGFTRKDPTSHQF